jgi:hypothetical protein
LLVRKWQLLDKREADKKRRQAARRERTLVVATCVGLLMATVATLSLAIWFVRVRRVAKLYQVF